LTALAWAGVLAGIFLSRSQKLSAHLAAAGGGMLFGIAVFWLLPEMKALAGWRSLTATAVACVAIAGLDRLLVHTGHSPRQGVIVPLLVATAAHSFVDGWSVRALATQPLTDVAVPLGLALHKIPEGAALGWVARHLSSSQWTAALVCFAVEAVTLAGAWIEPKANRSGMAAFGPWWTVGVLAVISGSFIFLAIHAIIPAWKRPSVVLAFLGSLFAMAVVSMLRLFAV
jgi:zinc transporter ZupT